MDCIVCLLGLEASVKAGFPPSPFLTLTCHSHLTEYGYYLTGLQFIYSLAIYLFFYLLGLTQCVNETAEDKKVL